MVKPHRKFTTNLIKRMKDYIKARDMTRAAFGELMGVDTATISWWLNGKTQKIQTTHYETFLALEQEEEPVMVPRDTTRKKKKRIMSVPAAKARASKSVVDVTIIDADGSKLTLSGKKDVVRPFVLSALE